MLKKTVFKKRGKMFGWKGSISYQVESLLYEKYNSGLNVFH